jgi:hypothetical protein
MTSLTAAMNTFIDSFGEVFKQDDAGGLVANTGTLRAAAQFVITNHLMITFVSGATPNVENAQKIFDDISRQTAPYSACNAAYGKMMLKWFAVSYSPFLVMCQRTGASAGKWAL